MGGDYARDDDAFLFGLGARKYWAAGAQIDARPEAERIFSSVKDLTPIF